MNWISVLKTDQYPKERMPLLLFTTNGKSMVVTNMLSDWLIDKYSVTHFAIIEPPQSICNVTI